ANNTNAMDLIVCRNVLMYFSREQQRKVVANLRCSLVEGGRLVVSATEASRELFGEFAPPAIPGIALYRKVAPGSRPVVASPPDPVPAPLPGLLTVLPIEPRTLPAASPDHAADARRLANEGRLAEALAACDRALAEDKLVAAHHYLRG